MRGSRRDRHVALLLGIVVLLQGALLTLLARLHGRNAWQAILLTGVASLVVHQAWLNRLHLHHRVDMTLVMFSLGGLGMLLGMWADAGFGSLALASAPACCAPTATFFGSIFSWMTGLMLLFSLPPSILLTRCAVLARRSKRHWIATHLLGNLGMILGMVAAGRLLGRWMGLALGSDLVGAHLAMLAGMLAGMPAAEWLGQLALGLRPWRPAVRA